VCRRRVYESFEKNCSFFAQAFGQRNFDFTRRCNDKGKIVWPENRGWSGQIQDPGDALVQGIEYGCGGTGPGFDAQAKVF